MEHILSDIRETGYGLTMGVQSRLESRAHSIFRASHVGNTYVNRSMTGAVVGVHPFGGGGGGRSFWNRPQSRRTPLPVAIYAAQADPHIEETTTSDTSLIAKEKAQHKQTLKTSPRLYRSSYSNRPTAQHRSQHRDTLRPPRLQHLSRTASPVLKNSRTSPGGRDPPQVT